MKGLPKDPEEQRRVIIQALAEAYILLRRSVGISQFANYISVVLTNLNLDPKMDDLIEAVEKGR